MGSSSTDARRRSSARLLVLALTAAAGTVAGAALPPVEPTAALLTDTATVSATLTVRPCDPATRIDHVAALSPVLTWSFAGSDLRYQDVPAPGLPACDPHTLAWDLAGASEGGLSTTGDLPLVSPATFTVALLVDVTDLAHGGDLLSLTGADLRDVRVVVLDDGSLEVTYATSTTPAVVTTGPLPPGGTDGSTGALVVLVVGNPGVTVWVEGDLVATGPPEGAGNEPASLTVGAPAGSGRVGADVVVDEVMVIEEPMAGPAVRALHTALAAW